MTGSATTTRRSRSTLFTDVQCPRCADFENDVVDPLIEDYVRTGKAQINFKNFPLGVKDVTVGGIAVEAAAQQDHGWQYAELFMKNLDKVPEKGVDQDFLDAVAAGTPQLDTAQWEEDNGSAEAQQSAKQDVDLATNLRLPANPILVVEGPPARRRSRTYRACRTSKTRSSRVG